MRRIALAVAMAAGCAASSAAAEDAGFAALLRTPPASRDDVCRNGIISHRIERWRRGEVGPPAGGQAFAGVDAIMRDVMPDAVRALERQGCAPHYLWRFLACTDVPGGAAAGTEAALASLVRRCVKEIEAAGIAPSR